MAVASFAVWAVVALVAFVALVACVALVALVAFVALSALVAWVAFTALVAFTASVALLAVFACFTLSEGASLLTRIVSAFASLCFVRMTLVAAYDVPPSARNSAISEMTNAGLGALNRCLNIENLRRRDWKNGQRGSPSGVEDDAAEAPRTAPATKTPIRRITEAWRRPPCRFVSMC